MKCYTLMRNDEQHAGISKQTDCMKWLFHSELVRYYLQNFVQFWEAFKYKHVSNEESPEHSYNSHQKQLWLQGSFGTGVG